VTRITLKNNPGFTSELLRIGAPIALQQFVLAALNAVDILMVGQLGETAVAAVSLANQFFFLLNVLLFGIASGATVFGAQFWGARDLANLRRVLGMALLLATGAASVAALLAVLAPTAVLGVYTNDPEVILIGSRYLRIIGLGFVPFAITYVYAYMLRSTGSVRLPMVISITTLSLKTGLSYLLIFGVGGFAARGVEGAAIATALARFVECAALLALIYAGRGPIAAGLREMASFVRERWLVARFVHVAWPVIFGEFAWALASNTYQLIYARVGTDAVAAVSIAGTIENMAFVPFMGLSAAAAVLIGNSIGAGDEGHAEAYAGKSFRLILAGAIGVGAIIFLASGSVLGLYRVSPQTALDAQNVLRVMSFGIVVRACNMLMITSVMRAGGDTRYAFVIDVGAAWLIGIPLATIAGLVLHLPIHLVYLAALMEEFVKFFLALWRIRSGRWVHNVVQRTGPAEAVAGPAG
jgi:putative MATE family efflux protein